MTKTKLITFAEAKQFKLFLEDNLKHGKKGFDDCRYDFDEFLKDAQSSLYEGRQSYELKGFETKSGNPECFIFTE